MFMKFKITIDNYLDLHDALSEHVNKSVESVKGLITDQELELVKEHRHEDIYDACYEHLAYESDDWFENPYKLTLEIDTKAQTVTTVNKEDNHGATPSQSL